MSEADLTRRIGDLEAQLTALRNTVNTLPRSTGASLQMQQGQSTSLSVLPNALRQAFNWGFEWLGSKVNLKVKAGEGLALDASGLATKRKTAGGILCDGNGLRVDWSGISTSNDELRRFTYFLGIG